MCEPISMAIASFAVTAASAVTGFMGQQEAAKNQNLTYEINKKNAITAFEQKDASVGQRQQQEQEAAASDKFDTALEARKARATHMVAAGESGVSGLSVESLLREFSGREARFNDRVDHNTDWSMRQLQDEKKGYGYQAKDRIHSMQRAAKPSFVDAGLKIAGGAMDSFSAYKKWKT